METTRRVENVAGARRGRGRVARPLSARASYSLFSEATTLGARALVACAVLSKSTWVHDIWLSVSAKMLAELFRSRNFDQ